MVSITLVLGAIGVIVALSQLGRITEFAEGLIGGKEETIQEGSTVVVNEGDTSITVESKDNTSQGRPEVFRTPFVEQSFVSPRSARKLAGTSLSRAIRDKRIFRGQSLAERQKPVITSTQVNPIFFETLRKQNREQRKKSRRQLELSIPQSIKFSTSLAGAQLVTGVQFKRGSATAELLKKREAERAQVISTSLFGNFANPNFKFFDKRTGKFI